jgi:hypothetical protein
LNHDEGVFELGAFKVGDLFGMEEIVGGHTRGDLAGLVLNAQVGQEFQRIAQIACAPRRCA